MNGNDSSLADLHASLDNIYRDYITSNHSSDSVSTLEDPPGPSNNTKKRLPDVHISSRLSSLAVEDDDRRIKSAPMTPKSGDSFDFNPRQTYQHKATTNSSLNVLMGSEVIEDDFTNLVDRRLKAKQKDDVDEAVVSDDDDEIPLSKELAESKQKEAKEWQERGSATKRITTESGEVKVIRRTVNDFKFGRLLGEGSYSTVVLATDKNNSKQYAVKILDKRHIIKEKKVKYVNIEKHALNRLTNRMGIISLYFTFQDLNSLYFVLDYASNGELLTLIKKYNTLNEDCTRHFGAQILDAIQYMHDNGVIHRDIKPENILLDDKMRIQITDFGTARLLEKKDDESEEYPVDVRAKSFVGTAEYVSPELLENKYCGKPGDIWAFGCIIYQMIAGKPPFKATNEYLTFQKITKLQYAFSAGFPSVIRDLIKKILVLQPSKRITIAEIQKHYFFHNVNFKDYDSIWKDPPELSPYKMSAESMMKIPEIATTTNTGAKSKKTRPKVKKNATSPVIASSAERPPNPSRITSDSVNAASVAAFVLNKSQNDDSTKANSPALETKKSAAPDYIPGTNILRPQVRTLFSRPNSRPPPQQSSPQQQQRAKPSTPSAPTTTSTLTAPSTVTTSSNSSTSISNTSKSTLPTPKKSRVMEVTSPSAIDIAWVSFLNHTDERVLRIGPVIAHVESTDSFEKRNRGLLHASPLDISMSKPRSGTSLLSQMVNGNSDSSSNSNTAANSQYRNEGVAIFDHAKSLTRTDTRSSTNSSRKSSLFKKLRFGKDKDTTGQDKSNNLLLDKPKTCTMVVTTHGRCLICHRQEEDSDYSMIYEIKLKYPFIHFQELVNSNTSSNKFSRILPTTSTFVISSLQTSFVFEVESQELNQWTEALAKAKLNEIEREKLEFETYKNNNGSTSTNSSTIEANVPNRSTSLAKRQSQTPPLPNTQPPPPPQPPQQHPYRKPPPGSPPVQNELNMHTGLPRNSTDSGWLQAAQLAVLNQSAQSPDNRRSSFEKKEENYYKPKLVKTISGNGGVKPSINSSNSKFLARSSRRK
ncbi:Serine/threonine-protein kinase PKH2 [Spathaspora sp. JA1]|nr:Serine/threonine-protein kinase PKH2 [Spathaspora sp. JA1]